MAIASTLTKKYNFLALKQSHNNFPPQFRDIFSLRYMLHYIYIYIIEFNDLGEGIGLDTLLYDMINNTIIFSQLCFFFL